jgi:hypothetical protein
MPCKIFFHRPLKTLDVFPLFALLGFAASAADAQNVTISWDQPLSAAPVTAYQLYQDDQLLCETFDPSAREITCPTELGAKSVFSVTAVYGESSEAAAPDDTSARDDLAGAADDPAAGAALDAFPTDPAASVDSDGDGMPDSWTAGMTAADSTSGLMLDPFPDAANFSETGIIRTDGGPVTSNLANGKPRADLEYIFQTRLEYDNSVAGVWLLLNGYPMAMDCGTDPDFSALGGVFCSVATELGPAHDHSYQIVALGTSDYNPLAIPLIRTGRKAGPVVEMLNGPNMLGIAKDMRDAGVGPADLFAGNPAFQWVSNGLTTDTNHGSFAALDNGGFQTLGKGYFVIRDLNATLPDLSGYPETSAATVAVDLRPGWNIIGNPYGGNIGLGDVRVQRNAEAPLSWAEACTNRWLTNSIYSYLGSDWGSSYSFDSVGGDPEATLTPWVGYWIYLIRDDADYKLIFTKP